MVVETEDSNVIAPVGKCGVASDALRKRCKRLFGLRCSPLRLVCILMSESGRGISPAVFC